MKKLLTVLILLLCCAGCSSLTQKKEISAEQLVIIDRIEDGSIYYSFNPFLIVGGPEKEKKALISESKRKKIYEIYGYPSIAPGWEGVHHSLESFIDVEAEPSDNLKKGDIVTFTVYMQDYAGNISLKDTTSLEEIEDILGVHFVPWKYTVE